jgi:hypothetical protein
MQVGVIQILGSVAHVVDLHDFTIWFVPSCELRDMSVLDTMAVVLPSNTHLH